ncbi:hypothetical protein KEJ34_05940 [Candidatus Bathyarchaeota archaeon]|nr:hypothetical protein [Candidatus Bathyarchaeota archaeon]
MKSSKCNIKSLAILTLFSLMLLATFSYETKGYNGNVKVWLMLYLREYGTDIPINNVSISATISSVWGDLQGGPRLTDDYGGTTVFLGEFINKSSLAPPRLTQLTITDNYTLIKVNDIFLEEIRFAAVYASNQVKYTNLQIRINQENIGEDVFFKVNCWALKSKVVNISDSDPVTGERSIISVKPAIKISSGATEKNIYESYYLAPLNYEIQIAPVDAVKYPYPSLRILIDENTSFINWMYYAAKFYREKEISSINKEINWFSSTGLLLIREIEEQGVLENLLKRSLDFYRRKEYNAALNGMRLFNSRAADLKRWLSNLKISAIVSAVSVGLLAYGMASIFSNFIFEEPAESKKRLTTKTILFASLVLTFSFTNPASKIACAIIIEKAINAPVPTIDALTVLIGTFVISAFIYLLMTLASLRRGSITDLAVQLGIRSFKRRPFRTILTLVTIIIVVSSSILFINISVARETRIKKSWPGTGISCIVLEADPYSTGLSKYDVEWIERQEWCKNVSYIETVKKLDYSGENMISRISLIQVAKESPQTVDIIFIDPAFMDEYYNLSKYVRGFWKEFSAGEKVILLPTSYDVAIGEYVTLKVDETLITITGMGAEHLGSRSLGSFRVVGKFDQSQLLEFERLDGTLLFEKNHGPAQASFALSPTVLLPIGSIKDPSVAISEITVIMEQNFDPADIAREVAYSFGVPVVANKNGLAALVIWSLEISIAGFIPYLIPLFIAGLMIYVTMASIYEERRRELFTLATLGLDPKNTFLTFIIETLLFGLMGTFIGFFGSYILVILISHLASLFGGAFPASYANWSVFTVFVALFTGVIMVFLGGYIPSMRAQGLSLMGRVKTRELLGELITEGDKVIFTLPIRETVQNSELLYNYVKETLGKIPRSLIDQHSIKGEIRGDGSFDVSFVAMGSGQRVFIPCELKGVRDKEILTLTIEVSASYREYEQIRRVLRDLEAHMIGFSTWRDMQLKMKIVREAPKKQKTVDEILDEIRSIIEQIKDFSKKLRILESQKGKLTEEIYNEFRQKYLGMLDEKFKTLRSVTIGLEPYSEQIQEEIKKINVEIERITVAYNLGEISEEEYIKICSPLQNRLTMLKSKLKELEEIFEFLKKPMGII